MRIDNLVHRKIIGVTFYKDKFVVYSDDNKNFNKIVQFTEDNFKEVWNSFIDSNNLRNNYFTFSINDSLAKIVAFSVKTNLTKSKKRDKLIENEIRNDIDVPAEEYFLNYRYYTDKMMPAQMILTYSYIQKNELNKFLDAVGNVKILSIEIFPYGLRKKLKETGDYIIIHTYTENGKHKVGLYVYRDEIIFAYRTIDIVDFDSDQIEVEVLRTTDYIRNVVKDYATTRWVVVNEIPEFDDEIEDSFDRVNIKVVKSAEALFFSSKGLTNNISENGKFNLLPKDRRKSRFNNIALCILSLQLILVVIAIIFICMNKRSFKVEVTNHEKATINQEVLLAKIKGQLEDNSVFRDLEKGNSYEIKKRVALNYDRYDTKLSVILSLIPEDIIVQSIKFDDDLGQLNIIGQSKDYMSIQLLYNNFKDANLTQDANFSSMTYDKENQIINFEFKCTLDMQAKKEKQEAAAKSSTNK